MAANPLCSCGLHNTFSRFSYSSSLKRFPFVLTIVNSPNTGSIITTFPVPLFVSLWLRSRVETKRPTFISTKMRKFAKKLRFRTHLHNRWNFRENHQILSVFSKAFAKRVQIFLKTANFCKLFCAFAPGYYKFSRRTSGKTNILAKVWQNIIYVIKTFSQKKSLCFTWCWHVLHFL